MNTTTLRPLPGLGGARRLVVLATGLLVLGWLLNTPPGLLGKADAIGYAVCHRIEVRSFHLGDRPLPLCARCTGMYLGAVLGLAYQALSAPRRGGLPSRSAALILGPLVLAFALDGLNSFLQIVPGAPALYPTSNWTRLGTGTGLGVALAAVLFPAFNQTIWRVWDPRPALGGLRSLGGLLVLALLMDGIVLFGNPVLLYPLALLSASGVLVILAVTYTMILVLGLRWENRFGKVRELAVPLTAGGGLAILQVVIINLGRFWVTGTWDGFHLG